MVRIHVEIDRRLLSGRLGGDATQSRDAGQLVELGAARVGHTPLLLSVAHPEPHEADGPTAWLDGGADTRGEPGGHGVLGSESEDQRAVMPRRLGKHS